MIPLTVVQHNGQDVSLRVFYIPALGILSPPITGTKTIGGITANFTKVEYVGSGGNKEVVFCYETALEIDALRDMSATNLLAAGVLDLDVAAAGEAQSAGTGILKTITQFGTVDDVGNADSAQLPDANPGNHLIIINNGADPLNIFPNVDENIEGSADDAETVLAPNHRLHLVCEEATTWKIVPDPGDGQTIVYTP